MIGFNKKRDRKSGRVDPEEITRQAEESLSKIRGQQERVNHITVYLNQRELKNGFGDDFEITLIPKGAS